MNCEYIVGCAKKTAERYGRDPFFAASQCGALISFKDLGSLKGAFFGAMPTPAIVINCALDEKMQSIVCAHELGHFLLHKDVSVSCESINFEAKTNAAIMEREANVFAAAFLIDSKRALDSLKDGYTVAQVASMLETDVNLLLFLLNSLGLTDMPESTFLN